MNEWMTFSQMLFLDIIAETCPFILAPSRLVCSPLLPRAAEPLVSALLLFPCLACNQEVLTKQQSLEHIFFVLCTITRGYRGWKECISHAFEKYLHPLLQSRTYSYFAPSNRAISQTLSTEWEINTFYRAGLDHGQHTTSVFWLALGKI